uniref:cation-translocating P-type ATPase n=1 Tax=Aquibium sp. A9E412 TaxID=2976767 RepID=UPI0025B21704|nr:HAD-IC family P-type ATPase [Aquibium sp. A9E412]
MERALLHAAEPSGIAPHEAAGLGEAEARARLASVGPNALPEAPPPSLVAVFLRQFLSPLIYILLAAALVSLALSDIKDAVFIGAVLLLNGVIGAGQEYSAGRAAAALRQLEEPQATVVRDGHQRVIDARGLVPGDLVLLEAGARVPADLRVLAAADLRCDESLLTGESEPVRKAPSDDAEARGGRAFAGSMITRGRGRGLVTATGRDTEMGKIAAQIARRSIMQPPLVIRMERFSRTIALTVAVAIAALMGIGLLRDMGLSELFMMAVGLAVAAIPEGLPVAISVALAIGMRRMARVHVIVRKMPAIEALGSCTMIATDKTGTLTRNELTVTDICLPDGTLVDRGLASPGEALPPDAHEPATRDRLVALLRAATLPNEARLIEAEEETVGIGDTVDVALLEAAQRSGIAGEIGADREPVARIPYEPDLRYAASFHRSRDRVRVFVKGAPETLIAMAGRMADRDGVVPADRERLLAQKSALAARGLRVLAFAEGEIATEPDGDYGEHHLVDLVFLGLAGLRDPVRQEVPQAIADCHSAGIAVAMVTGDDARTASVIAGQAGLVFDDDQVVTGEALRAAETEGEAALDALTRRAVIYARVDPAQKLSIVMSMARNGHFVAVTGDGVNDAPALKHAHVGVAMGRKGTDVAKESADIIITDDNFASIVRGILEGRVAYANIRKVIFLLVSTGAAEVVLFLLAMPLGLPMPLLPVQLLWLNLVANGIQDVALATEGAEGDELTYPPRKPREPIFDRLMIRRIWHATAVMGVGSFAVFWWLTSQGVAEDAARNLVLLLFVLFSNVHAFNSRSEHHSVFRQPLRANPFLVVGVLTAQGLHIAAMYIPWLSGILGVAPVSLAEWSAMLGIASLLLVVMEFEKWWDRRGLHPAAGQQAR